MPKQYSQQGFSLIEVLVAILIVTVGLVGLAGMQLVGLKGNQQSFSKNLAAHHTQALLERMRGNAAGVHGDAYLTDSSTLSCATPPTDDCTDTASSCNSAQMATYDIYQSFCGGQGSSSGGIRRDLSNARIVITCPVDCETGVTMNLSWQEQVLGKESAGNTVPRQLTLNTRI